MKEAAQPGMGMPLARLLGQPPAVGPARTVEQPGVGFFDLPNSDRSKKSDRRNPKKQRMDGERAGGERAPRKYSPAWDMIEKEKAACVEKAARAAYEKTIPPCPRCQSPNRPGPARPSLAPPQPGLA